MGVEEEVLGALVPPGIGKALKWRLVVSLSIGTLGLFAAWTLGWFTALGFSSGFARADETKALSGRLASIEDNQKTGLRITLAQEICRLYFLRDSATGEAWRVFNDSLDKHQEEYATVNKGIRYPVVECSKPK
jgi:hypothetical protein